MVTAVCAVVGPFLGYLAGHWRSRAVVARLEARTAAQEATIAAMTGKAHEVAATLAAMQAHADRLREQVGELTGAGLPDAWELLSAASTGAGVEGAVNAWSTYYWRAGERLAHSRPRLFAMAMGHVGAGKTEPHTLTDTSLMVANCLPFPGLVVAVAVELYGDDDAALAAVRSAAVLSIELGSVVHHLGPLSAFRWTGEPGRLAGVYQVAAAPSAPAPVPAEPAPVLSVGVAGLGVRLGDGRFAVLAAFGEIPPLGGPVRMRVTLGLVPDGEPVALVEAPRAEGSA